MFAMEMLKWLLKIATTDQLADFLTKGLNQEVLEPIQKLAQGW
jgi:hypothetical protein